MIKRWRRIERRLLRRGWRGRLALEITYAGLAFLTLTFTLYLRAELARRSGAFS